MSHTGLIRNLATSFVFVALFTSVTHAFGTPPIRPSLAGVQPAAQDEPDEIDAADETAAPPIASTDGPASELTAGEEPQLEFSFGGTAWREVIEWLASEADLALHIGEMPTGSFTYTDPQTYTPDEAIARINLFLLPQGYSLIRSGELLSVLNLGDPRSLQQLDVLAQVVTADELADLNTYDVVKCIFSLGELEAEEAVDELSGLNLMTIPAVFNRTGRLMITDTVGNLRVVKTILDAFEPSTLDNGTIVRNFVLEHVAAEDILIVARPHLGLATGETIGIDVSVSSDPLGKNIFVTGVEDKVKLLESLIESLDQPDKSLSVTDGGAELKSHLVSGGNVETVYNVLLTLLAGKTIRLSMDEKANSIVALATPEVQREIEATIQQLQATEAEFVSIPLKTADPFLVVSLLEQMLDIPDPVFDGPDDDNYNHDAPKIDADPDNRRLFVRAKPHEIERIRKIVEELDVDATGPQSDDEIRMLPVFGRQAIDAVETAARFWRHENLIVLYPATETRFQSTERVIADDETVTGQTGPRLGNDDDSTGRVLAGDIRSSAASIQCQPTVRGLLVQCDDIEALNDFVANIDAVLGPSNTTRVPPIVYYLKYTKPDSAIRMLAELLDGDDAVNDSGNLVNGFVSSGLFLSSLVTSTQGTTTMTAGSITVVADSRLNRLIAQGTAEDIERIEGYLKIIDKDASITSVETYGKAHIIELRHSNANEVAATLREAYGSRISGNSGGSQPQGGGERDRRGEQAGREREPVDRRDERNEDRDEQRGDERRGREQRGGAQPAVNLEPSMTIAVHEPSNSLIITAQDSLFREVEQLVKLIDARDERVTEIIAVEDRAAIEALRSVFGEPTQSSRGSIEFSGRQPATNQPQRRPRNESQQPERFRRDR